MKNYKLDTTLLPEVWVTWMSKDGRIWMSNKGKRQYRHEPWMDYVRESGNRPCGGNYYGNDNELNLV